MSKLAPSGSALAFSTYLGGSGFDNGTAAILDSAGNAYVTGNTTSANFPTTSGAFQSVQKSVDVFATKFTPSGSIVYSTYLGGALDDFGRAIAVDSGGNAYLTGSTRSVDFPTTAGAFQPNAPAGCSASSPCEMAFIAKLNSAGSGLAYASFLTGSTGSGSGFLGRASAVALDSAGNAYVAGSTTTDDFPTTPGAFQTTRQGVGDAFVSKLNSTGSALLYSTRLGGGFPSLLQGGASRTDGSAASSIALDSAGNAYLVGTTNATNFPTVRPIQVALGGCSLNNICDAFIAKLNPSGSALVYSTYFGGTGGDSGRGIAVDSAGNAYVTGAWASGVQQLPQAGPLRSNVFSGAFVIKITDTNNPVVPAAVTNGASFLPGLAPGEIGTIFGTGITTVSGIVTASTLPLPRQLAGTSLTVNGVPAPLFAVANVNGLEQINFQAPWEGASTATFNIPAKIVVTKSGATSDPVYVRFAGVQVGIFMVDANTPAIQHASDFSLVTPSNAAKRGEVIIIVTGLGLVQPNPGTGNPAPSSPLSQCTDPNIAVSFGNRADLAFLKPLFCGLTPGFVGLYQVNIRVPDTPPSGNLDLIISVSGQGSNVVKLPVQ